MDKFRCPKVSLGVPKPFWGEAVSITVYLINRSPSTTVNFRTLIELWCGKPPNLSNLRVFGCAVFAHQKEDKPISHSSSGVPIVGSTLVEMEVTSEPSQEHTQEPETNDELDTPSSSVTDPTSVPETNVPELEHSDDEEDHPKAQAQAFRDYPLSRDRVRRAHK
ncbi:hypothetical protein M9H77_08370 [Catharanthus roseus]|uniref:Uncharacterized protein n=1 Tax=Catharanthus roseus TaxID=4058 RepID=A0ACC0BXQ1_CATRO|nr:hypothetical protein M9H77_08370 [Catharanthus roseus]